MVLAIVSIALHIHRHPARIWRLSDGDASAKIVVRASFRGWPVYAARSWTLPDEGAATSPWGQGFLGRFTPEGTRSAERPYIMLNLDAIERSAVRLAMGAGLFSGGGKPQTLTLKEVSKDYGRVNKHHRLKALLAGQIKNTLRHECRHFDDRFHGFSLADLETRAYLEELMTSSLGLSFLELRPKSGTRCEEPESHAQAACRIWKGFMEAPDIDGSEAAFYSLTPAERARRSRDLYERWYGIYEPLDPECTGALGFMEVYARP